MKYKNLLVILGRSHAMEILNELSKAPLRFNDMDIICKSKRTRYVRLKELEEKGLIKAVPKLIGRRSYTFYEITNVGVKALALGKNLLSLDKDSENSENRKKTKEKL
jgi:DNA-binding HxlR family transcriptional regulator